MISFFHYVHISHFNVNFAYRFMMGDNSHSCRGFETPTLGNDLWPMGFDVDLALDGPGARKGPGGSLSSAGLGGGGLNSLQAGTNTGAGAYNDIHQLSSLSSIWQRFDDLQAGDICQMTDLTNSLPKGDSETAQSLLAKLAGQDLGPDLSSGADPSHKELESSLFGQAQGMPHGGPANGQGITLSHKSQLESADIYGRMTCYGGKLILQLRHSNLNANYTLNVSECWLCGEKVTAGSQLCTHKHSFNGVFQVNEEFIQLDIDHYIPEQTLDPQDGQEMTDSVLQHSDSSGMHHDLGSTRELELPENISGGDALGMGAGAPGLHYGAGPDPNLVPPLSSANIMASTIPTNPSPCLNTSFGQLQLPGMPLTTNHSTMSPGIPGMAESPTLNATQPLCSASTPVFGLTHVDTSSTNALLTSTSNQRKISVQANQPTLASSYSIGSGINNFNMTNQMGSVTVPSQPNHRDLPGRSKHTLQYHLPFSAGGDYNCHTLTSLEAETEKNSELPCLTSLHTVPASLDTRVQRTDVLPKKTEIGAKKRKSRAQRKPSVIQMRDYKNDTLDNTSVKNFYTDAEMASVKPYKIEPLDSAQTKNFSVDGRQGGRPDASIEDWIRHNLPEGDLIVSDNQMKQTVDSEDKLQEMDLKDNAKSLEINSMEKNQKLESLKSREPDQTSRLAAHMLAKGLDLSCRVCSKDFGKDIRNYKTHMKEHGLQESELFACSFCPKTFAKGKHYTQHLKIHVRTQRFSCKLCNASYSRKAKLGRHMLSHSQEHQVKKHKCSKCPKAFSTKEYLQAHLKVHGGKKYECDTCGFLCSSPFNLDTHKKKHLGDKPFKCELCEKTFVRRDFLDNHMEQVHKNKKSKCEKCGKLFSRKDVLKRHLAVHNNETYDCDICQKKFSRKDRLASHKKLHKMNCEYKCSLCPASFSRKNVLDKHEKIHKTKEQCKECYKFLPTKQRLESHMKLHEKNCSSSKEDGEGMHKCDICEKSLTSRDILRKHIRKIHGKFPEPKKKVEVVEREKRFFCQWCSKGFTRSCNLSTHLLKAHSKDSEDDFDDDLPSVLQSSRYESGSARSNSSAHPSSTLASFNASSSCHGFSTSSHSASSTTSPGASQSSCGTSAGLSFPVSLASSSPTSSQPPTTLPPPPPPPPLSLSSTHFSSSGRPESPINLSTEAITAAAYLLAYPSYPGPY